MTGLKNYQNWTYTIPANGEARIATTGNYIVCIEATAPFDIGVDDASGQYLTEGLGFFMPNEEEFKNVIITNTSGAPNTIRLAIGRGDFRDSRLSLAGDVNLSVAANVDDILEATLATATAAAIAPSVNQREIIIQASPDNTGNLRVNANGVIDRGLWLQPGQSITLAAAATVNVRNDSGVDQVYSFMKVID